LTSSHQGPGLVFIKYLTTNLKMILRVRGALTKQDNLEKESPPYQ
jgi:hypothetical protein